MRSLFIIRHAKLTSWCGVYQVLESTKSLYFDIGFAY